MTPDGTPFSSGDLAAATMMKRRYQAFGLNIDSQIELGGLAEREGGVADVIVTLTHLGIDLPAETDPPAFSFSHGSQLMVWGAVGAFLIEDNHIMVQPRPGASDSLLCLPLLGPVLGALMHMRGALVIHASAIAVGDDGIVIMADKGTGKSTTSAALVSRGDRLLSDDVVAVDLADPATAHLWNAYPRIKVADGVAAQLGWDVEAGSPLPASGASAGKRSYDVSHAFKPSRTPLRRLYVLERGAEPSIVTLGRQEALSALIRFSYVSRFGSQLLAGLGMKQHLANCARLAASVPVARLTVANDLRKVGSVAAMIDHDLASRCPA